MQTVGKRSDSTGCHSGVARLCRNACLEQGKACTGSSPFLQGHESHHFQEIFILLQKFCYAIVQMVPSHGWLAQPRQPVCLNTTKPLVQSEHSGLECGCFHTFPPHCQAFPTHIQVSFWLPHTQVSFACIS